MAVPQRTLTLRLALEYMREGARLIHMHRKASELCWFVTPGGAVTDKTAEEIKRRPDVVGQKDGLFPGHDQTWRVLAFVARAA